MPATEMLVQSAAVPAWTGVDSLKVTVPLPSWPSSSSPQHQSVPSVRIAQALLPPAEMAV